CDFNDVIYEIETLPYFTKVSAMIALIALQIFLAFLPGEPLELASGYIFGSFQGTIVCLIGSMIGTIIVYYLARIFQHSIIDK
ncbi:VTT domain-containing protein, partial [Blautia faecis]